MPTPPRSPRLQPPLLPLSLAAALSCGGPQPATALPVRDLDVQGWSMACVALADGTAWLAATADGQGYAFSARGLDDSARFFLQPSDLGTYLPYDADRGYLSAEDGPLLRQTSLQSDATRIVDGVIDDAYVSGAEWNLEPSDQGGDRYQLRHRRTGRLLGRAGLVQGEEPAAALSLVPAEGCTEHPELSLDATGTVTRTTFEDGSLYGIVDAHSHIFTNLSFGGGVFHGAPFHRLGVEHALPDCAGVHGQAGRKDFFGWVYDGGGNDSADLVAGLGDLLAGELSEDNHQTDGYPTFSEWPDARQRSTHQAQYHRWLERAWLGGLRLVVNHATSNAVICNLVVGEGFQPSRYDCEDMTAVDRIIDETWAMQDYVDARAGGQGKGWFRVVQSPEEAREVIAQGKLAVVLGIETSDLFDCHLTPREGGPTCDQAWIEAQLDAYHARGVRVIFPVHKYDNRFGPGDGSGDFIELGNFLNSGHWTNMTQDCPSEEGLDDGFDGDAITFGGLQQPREDYLSPPPEDLSAFPQAPLDTALGYVGEILEGPLDGYWCQNAGLTDAGVTLIEGMMDRGMIVELDHLPLWSYVQAFALLEAADYPAAGTHGRHWSGRLFTLGGVSVAGLGRCQDPANPGATLGDLAWRLSLVQAAGGYPGVGFGFDLNGFAGAPGPRFAEGACGTKQFDPVTYPFASYAGDVQFTPPMLGQRAVDFNQEGMIHIGLLPELIEDARHDAVSDADLEPLFRSAEAWLRMWEKAEARAAERGGAGLAAQ